MISMNQNTINLNKNISRLLGGGIYITVFCYSVGIILLLLLNNGTTVTPEKSTITGITSFFDSLFGLHAEPFFYLGTITLIFTPIIRVFFSIILFYKNGEKKFILITSIVAAILTISIILGVTFSLNLG